MVYVPDSIRNHRRTDLERDHIEAIWLELHIEKSTILLCHICQPPNSVNNILDEQVTSEEKELMITRAFNCNILVKNATTNFLTGMMKAGTPTFATHLPGYPDHKLISDLCFASAPMCIIVRVAPLAGSNCMLINLMHLDQAEIGDLNRQLRRFAICGICTPY